VALEAETGDLQQLVLEPYRIRKMGLRRAKEQDSLWLAESLNREGQAYGTRFRILADGSLILEN
jgi:hypothetical protein